MTNTKHKDSTKKDDFESVAKRLECDPDLEKFAAKLKKIAEAKPKTRQKK